MFYFFARSSLFNSINCCLASSVYPFVLNLDSVKKPLGCCFVCELVFLPNINFVGFSFFGRVVESKLYGAGCLFFEGDVWNPSLIVQVQS